MQIRFSKTKKLYSKGSHVTYHLIFYTSPANMLYL